jgi:hypothetical protein
MPSRALLEKRLGKILITQSGDEDSYKKSLHNGRLFCFIWVGLWQIKCPHQEHRHLRTSDRRLRTVITRSAPSCNPFCYQLLNPRCCPIIGIYVPKAGTASHCRRIVGGSIFGTQQKDRHLRPRDRGLGAVVTAAASSRNTLGCQLLDPGGCPITRTYVSKACAACHPRRVIG